MKERVEVVKFVKKFKDTGFQFEETDWAACLLYMAENFEDMPPPIKNEAADDEID